MSGVTIATFDQLQKVYDNIVIFEDVSFHLTKGEIFSILGPSGCGKTTLLRCIAGLEQLTSGKVWIEGKEISNLPSRKREIVMMFQQPLLFPQMTSLENVTYGLKIKKVAKEDRKAQGKAILEKIGMAEHAHKYPHELSGGQQQRIALGRALMMKPKLLLLDEPLSSLDPHLRVQLRSWLKDVLKEHETTAIFVTHDKEEAMVLADRIGIMKDGKIQQIGQPKEVYYEPVNEIVADFFSDGLLLPDRSFVHSHHLVLWDEAMDKQDTCSFFEGKVKGIAYKGGQPFYQIQMKLSLDGQQVFLPTEKTLGMNESVLLAAKKENIIQFKGV